MLLCRVFREWMFRKPPLPVALQAIRGTRKAAEGGNLRSASAYLRSVIAKETPIHHGRESEAAGVEYKRDLQKNAAWLFGEPSNPERRKDATG